MDTDPRATRRAAMPEVSRVWDDFTDAFGTPAYFRGVEKASGRVVEFPRREAK